MRNNKRALCNSHYRLKQAKDKGKKQQTQSSRPGSTHASTKVLAARRMSRKDLEEANPLLAKELAQAVSEHFFKTPTFNFFAFDPIDIYGLYPIVNRPMSGIISAGRG